jgi:cytochrome c biogenesis protein CcmG/thiol:disulfide interchange protein DsbE
MHDQQLDGNEAESGDTGDGRRSLSWIVAPLVVFVALAALFMFALEHGDPSKLPSALIGKPVPATFFPALEGLVADGDKPVPGFSEGDLSAGRLSVVNFWASWCAPCIDEHPLLIELGKRTGVAIYGVNYKDQPANARRFLGRYRNPFTAVGTDANGRGAIEWGVYGMPETFVVNGKGEIIYKHVGPISAESLRTKLIPVIETGK